MVPFTKYICPCRVPVKEKWVPLSSDLILVTRCLCEAASSLAHGTTTERQSLPPPSSHVSLFPFSRAHKCPAQSKQARCAHFTGRQAEAQSCGWLWAPCWGWQQSSAQAHGFQRRARCAKQRSKGAATFSLQLSFSISKAGFVVCCLLRCLRITLCFSNLL